MTHLILWNSYSAGDSGRFDPNFKWDCSNYSPNRPLGPHQLASFLRSFGYKIRVIDFCSHIKTKDLVSITEKLITKDTIGIGISITFLSNSEGESEWIIKARDILESRYPDVEWIMGGNRVARFRNKLHWKIFNGYAEDTVLKWLDEKTKEIDFRKPFDIKNSKTHYLDEDFIQSGEILNLELGRGCQFKCKFCRYPLVGKTPGTYTKFKDTIKNELLENYERWGTTRYNFIDDTVNESKEKVEDLARIAQELPFELEWVGYCRPDLIWAHRDTIQTLKDSGLRSATFGIETFHPEASKKVGKGWSGRRAKDFLLELKQIWKNDITWLSGMIVGLPGEPLEELDEHNYWFMENEMYCWRWSPLIVYKNIKDRTWLSEFDINSEKYGIRFKEDGTWEHDSCTFNEAYAKAAELTKFAKFETKISGFTLTEVCSTGIPLKEMMDSREIDVFPFYRIEQELDIMVKKYVDFQLK